MQKLKVNEIFNSIQGEGLYIGQPQSFVRLTGCNMRCSWCDTKYAFYKGKDLTANEILAKLNKFKTRVVCLTGGEPLFQARAVRELLKLLKKNNYEVHLETNGSIYDNEIFDNVDFISIDAKPPSSGEKPNINILNKAIKRNHQIKIVVKTNEDLKFSKNLIKHFPGSIIILQPEGGSLIESLQNFKHFNSNIRILPQLHKIIGVK